MGKLRNRDAMRYAKEQGLYGVYVIQSTTDLATKIGISQDPVRRFSDIQHANWLPLSLHRYWWTPGRPLAVRIEAAVLHAFAKQIIRGEWIRAKAVDVEFEALRHASLIRSSMMTQQQLEQWVAANLLQIATG